MHMTMYIYSHEHMACIYAHTGKVWKRKTRKVYVCKYMNIHITWILNCASCTYFSYSSSSLVLSLSCTCVCIYIYVCMYLCTCSRWQLLTCPHIYVYICTIYIYIYIYIYIHTHTHAHTCIKRRRFIGCCPTWGTYAPSRCATPHKHDISIESTQLRAAYLWVLHALRLTSSQAYELLLYTYIHACIHTCII